MYACTLKATNWWSSEAATFTCHWNSNWNWSWKKNVYVHLADAIIPRHNTCHDQRTRGALPRNVAVYYAYENKRAMPLPSTRRKSLAMHRHLTVTMAMGNCESTACHWLRITIQCSASNNVHRIIKYSRILTNERNQA